MRLNQVLFTGRLGKDPFCVEQEGDFLVYLNIAENLENRKVRWHKFLVLDDTAKKIALNKSLKKGDLVLIEASLIPADQSNDSMSSLNSIQVLEVLKIQSSKTTMGERNEI